MHSHLHITRQANTAAGWISFQLFSLVNRWVSIVVQCCDAALSMDDGSVDFLHAPNNIYSVYVYLSIKWLRGVDARLNDSDVIAPRALGPSTVCLLGDLHVSTRIVYILAVSA